MMFLPPYLSKKLLKRTDRCVRCEKLTNPALAHCEHCGHAFTNADRAAMAACRDQRSKGAISALLFPIAFVLIVVVMLLAMVGCSPAPVDPEERGGSWLDTPVAVSCRNPSQFSPDGEWLAFWTEFSPDPATIPPVVRLGLLHWPTRDVRLVAGFDDDLSLGAASLCWNEQDNMVHVAGSRRNELRRSDWFQVQLAGSGELVAAGPPPDHCQGMPSRLWESHRPVTHTREIERGVAVLQVDDRNVVLRTHDGRELARHETQSLGASGISVRRYAWSPDGEWLAYTLGEMWASVTAGPSRTYLVSTQEREPTLLGSGFHTLLWRDDDELLGCGRRLSTRDQRLALWRPTDFMVK